MEPTKPPKSWLEIGWRDLVTPPWRRYEITSRWAPAEIVAVMQRITGPRGWFGPQTSREFHGTVTADGFVVSRTLSNRNSFLPVIIGRLEWVPGGTCIRITMRLNWFVLAFWVFWMTAVTSGLLTVLIQARDVNGNLAPTLFPLGMLVFGYLVCSVLFGYEARRAKNMLDNLLRGDGSSRTL